MKVNFYTKTGAKKDPIEVSKDLFGIEPNEPLLIQYVHIFKTNQRQGTSKVKTRSEVSGGGRKPWAQKGTGKARHGSIRSPIWRHGGVVHGPIPKKWHLDFPRKMRALALKSALSCKLRDNGLSVMEAPGFENPSSKGMLKILEKLDLHGKVLFVQKENDVSVRKSLSNLENVKCSLAENLNAYEVLLADQVILIKDALKFLEGKYENK